MDSALAGRRDAEAVDDKTGKENEIPGIGFEEADSRQRITSEEDLTLKFCLVELDCEPEIEE